MKTCNECDGEIRVRLGKAQNNQGSYFTGDSNSWTGLLVLACDCTEIETSPSSDTRTMKFGGQLPEEWE